MQNGKRHSRNVTHLIQHSLLALIWSHEMAADQGDRPSHGFNWHRLWPEGWSRWPQGHEKPTGKLVQDLLFRDEETQLRNDRLQGKLQTGWAKDEQKVGTTYEAAFFANFGRYLLKASYACRYSRLESAIDFSVDKHNRTRKYPRTSGDSMDRLSKLEDLSRTYGKSQSLCSTVCDALNSRFMSLYFQPIERATS